MAEEVPFEDQLTELGDILAGLDLKPEQRAHLNAILQVAADVAVDPGKELPLTFAADFHAAFEPGQAELIREYVAASRPQTVESANMVTRDAASGFLAKPAMVTRGVLG